jgi:hypothetical protein
MSKIGYFPGTGIEILGPVYWPTNSPNLSPLAFIFGLFHGIHRSDQSQKPESGTQPYVSILKCWVKSGRKWITMLVSAELQETHTLNTCHHNKTQVCL